jgi:hypothetical protein
VAARVQRHHPGAPVHRWFTPPGLSGVASRLGLRSGSFAGHRLLLGAGPPTHTSVGHRALPRLELPRARLTPRSASGRLSHQAYSSPTLAGPVRRSQSLQTSSCRGLTAEARDATRPPQVTWTALSDHPRPNHLHRSPAFVAGLVSWSLRAGVLGFGCYVPPRHTVPALHGFTARSGLVLRLLPLRTPPCDDALGVGYSTKTAKR